MSSLACQLAASVFLATGPLLLTVRVFFGTLPKNVWQSHFAKVTTFIVFAILVLATAVPDIQVVMSLGGSLGGTFIAFMYFGQI